MTEQDNSVLAETATRMAMAAYKVAYNRKVDHHSDDRITVATQWALSGLTSALGAFYGSEVRVQLLNSSIRWSEDALRGAGIDPDMIRNMMSVDWEAFVERLP